MDGKKEDKGFGEFVTECEVKRLQQLDNIFEESGEFADCEAKEDRLYEKLRKALPQDMVRDLNRYGDVHLLQRTLTRVFFYKHGFKDAMAFSKLVGEKRENVRLDIKIL